MSLPEPPERFRGDLEGVAVVSPSRVTGPFLVLWGLLLQAGLLSIFLLMMQLWWVAGGILAVSAAVLLWSISAAARTTRAELRITATHAVLTQRGRETRIPRHAIHRVERASDVSFRAGLAVHWWDGHRDHKDLVAWRLSPEECAWLEEALAPPSEEETARDKEGERALDALRRGVEVQ